MSFEKENFLRTRLIRYLQQLPADTPAKWGKMSAQQMVEHLNRDAFAIANGQIVFEKIISADKHLQKLREFIISNKAFREYTRNPLLGEEPAPLQYKTYSAALGALHEQLIQFFEVFEKNPGLQTRNPVFGDLDFDANVHLLFKHAVHHLKQFGIVPPEAYSFS